MRGLGGLRVLVTGAGSGIGAAIATRLLEEGSKVAAADLVVPVQNVGSTALCLASDVTDEGDVKALIASVVETFGGIDAVVLCAGNYWAGPTHEMPVQAFQRVIAVHVVGTFLCCRAALPHMIEQQSGRIVTLGSTASVSGAALMTAYAAAKGAVLQLTRSIAIEYARFGIRANCLCPGPTETPLLRALLAELAVEGDSGQRYVNSIPAARFAEPAEIAATAVFLLSDEASYTQGAAVFVDGGFTAS